jgi:exodeoxyribonuclease V alpha subunit
MVAPTGKAAAHLQASVQRRLESLDCSAAVRAAVPVSASTIHRCLGLRAGSGTRFRHGPDNLLEVDVLLVDEASMVDLALMTRLVEALPAAARLILLGDRDQLASVEAGAVLGDIGHQPGEEPGAAPPAVIHLTRNYRFEAGSGIDELTRSINRGDAATALALLDDAARPEIRLVEPTSAGGGGKALADAIASGYAPFLAETRPEDQLAALDEFRILCAHRHGEGGVDALNALAERLLDLDAGPDRPGLLRPGRPVGITRNDYELELYNGDVGIVASDPAAPGGVGRVFFRAPDGCPRWFSPLSIGGAETAFATTVHKSQGSEFAAIALVLPAETSPILSRELIYTAVSRARESVTIFSSRGVLREAIDRRIERSSGLSEALWG